MHFPHARVRGKQFRAGMRRRSAASRAGAGGAGRHSARLIGRERGDQARGEARIGHTGAIRAGAMVRAARLVRERRADGVAPARDLPGHKGCR